ncbi:MAG: methyltransferase domain-containing protein [Candidatus Omnitrophica bacterium]|nr:methyltransferase domain-containing protein [Candidatus Omnitrophota bacterium]
MKEKNEIKAKYNRIAGKIEQDLEKIKNIHKDISPVMKYFRQRKVETALGLGRFKEESKILDVGANMGQYTTLLAEKGFRMVGIDLSDKAVDVAKKQAQMLNFNIDYFQADIEDLSLFEDEIFDGVVSFSTLRYVSDLKKALKEIYRVTKKNGIAVLDFPNKYCPWFTLLKNKFGVENHIYDHFFSTNELISLFKETGFCSIDTKKIMFTHYTFKPEFFGFYKIIDLIGERTFFIKELAAIIMCKGIKA